MKTLSYSPLVRNYRSMVASYEEVGMYESPWSYLMDDFGNAVITPSNTHIVRLLLWKAGLSPYPK